MKKPTIQFLKILIIILVFQAVALSSWAQVPQKMSYQCVVRNVSGILVVNKSVGIRISILLGTPTGTMVFQETYSPNPQTNANGLVSIEIGGGTPTIGTFSSINWASGPYFLKTETDPSGGINYTITGTIQLLSVPYALRARTVELEGDSDPTNEIQALSISGTNLTLSKGGGTVAIPGDNWGSQTIVTETTLNGQGTTSSPLKIAQQSAIPGQVMKWSGTTWIPGNDFVGTTVPGGATGNVQFNNGGTLGGNDNFLWDNSSKGLQVLNSTSTAIYAFSSTAGIGICGGAGTGFFVYPNSGVMGCSPSGNGVSGWSQTGYSGYFDGPKFYVRGKVGIGTTTPDANLEINGNNGPNIIINDNGGADRPGIQFKGNDIQFIEGDDVSNETFGFYSLFSNNRTYDARIQVHGNSTSNWGKYIGITHDGTDGIIDTDAGNIVLKPASNSLLLMGNATKTLGGTSWITISDIRLKNVLGNYNKGLSEIAGLQPVRYVYKVGNPRNLPTNEEQIGFIAQDVQKVFPEAVSEAEDGYLNFNFHAISVAMVNAVKELNEKVGKLETENDQLKTRLEKIESMIGASVEK
jgi:hypothetical protein